jgi:hypothetical protein
MDLLKMYQRLNGAQSQLGGLLNMARMISRGQADIFPGEGLLLLFKDPLAEELLFKDLEQVEIGIKWLRSEQAARQAAAAAPKSGE